MGIQRGDSITITNRIHELLILKDYSMLQTFKADGNLILIQEGHGNEAIQFQYGSNKRIDIQAKDY